MKRKLRQQKPRTENALNKTRVINAVIFLKKTTTLGLAFVLASFLLAIYYYPQMPVRMASHWNAAGEVNGYMSAFWGVFLVPLLSAALFGFFLVLPRLDPLRENYAKFQKYYDWFVVLFVAFMVYVYALTLLWNLGVSFSLPMALAPAFAALFYYCGVLIENAERNWFVGIRTPWTMSSERGWKRTHALGGKLFKACGIVSLLGLVFTDIALVFVIAPIIATAVFCVIFSYVEFKKEAKEKKSGKGVKVKRGK